MRQFWIVARHEFYRYFVSPLAYVYLICFLLLNGSFALYFGHWFARGQADLLPMFAFQPWLYLLFIPGISMRLWAEEFRAKTVLQILTMPVSIPALVWGKFAASWAFCALALTLTFPFWITVNLLGSPDNTVIAVGYLGSFLLAGCMLAISQTMSALTKNQVIALVLAVIANLVFFLSGIEYILGIFRTFMPLSILDMIASFSFLTHFDAISRGLLEARDLVFFASVILLFNFTSVLVVSFKTAGTTRWLQSNRRSYYLTVFFFLLLAFTGLNLLANNLLRRWQIDFTQEQLFTLTPSTRKVLENLPSPVTARLYYSPVLGKRNPVLRLMFDRLRLMLQQYAALSNGRFSFAIYDPEPLSNLEDRAINAGLQPLPVIEDNTNAFFGLVLSDELDHRRVIPFFPLQRSDFLEQDVTEALYLLNRPRKKLGIITSLPMYEDIIHNVVTPKWEILNQLGKYYQITSIDNDNPQIGEQDVLLIAHPLGLSEDLQKNIYEYSRRGGKILLLMDIAAEAPRLFAPTDTPLQPSDLGNLPAAWGFDFNSQKVVADLGNSSTVDATLNYRTNPDFTQDPVQFYLRGQSFNRDFKPTARLKKMMMTSASVFTPRPGAEIYFLPLLQTGQNAALMPAEIVYNAVHPTDILRAFQADAAPKYLAARIISKKASEPFDLIVVGDSDFLYDNFWTEHQTILENNFAIPVLDNANFIFNALDTLLGDDTLISLRGKSAEPREFYGIEAERRRAAREFKIREKQIFDQIENTKKGLREIWAKKDFEGRSTFTADELAVIAGIRRQMDSLRRDLYQIRRDLNRNIIERENWVKFVNIYALPALLLLGLLVFTLSGRPRSRQHAAFTANRPLFYIAAASVLLLAAGLAAVHWNNAQTVADYEGKPLFERLPQQINQVASVELLNHEQKLEFHLQDGRWTTKDAPYFTIYQQRLRSFLSALLEAVYYEKKTADPAKLGLFGLTPPEADGSPATRITLRDARGKTLTEFEIGKYDIDLGRGSRGAYVKIGRQFQVWLAALEVVDLSLEPGEWGFSALWNLRFGRLLSADGRNNTDALADLAKTLLNARFDVFKALPLPQELPPPLLKLTLENEHRETAELYFYQINSHLYVHYQFARLKPDSALSYFSRNAGRALYPLPQADLEKIKDALAKL